MDKNEEEVIKELEEKFEEYVSDAIDHIPEMYQEKMKSIAINVDDHPSEEQVKKIGYRSRGALFGLYEGIPLPQRGGRELSVQPDVITIFRYPMIHVFRDEESLKKQVYKTLWHEVAHFFGLNHDQIHAAENK